MAKKTKVVQTPFSEKLILNQFMLDLIGFSSFKELAAVLKNTAEGYDENQISHFYTALIGSKPFLENAKIDRDTLLAYDMNINKHTKKMQGKRKEPISWKYFQYLCLLFVEIYLDKFFRNAENLLQDLNTFKAGYLNFVDIPDYELPQLRKIAIWNATGSGKTLLMHVNILQYQYYLAKYKQQKAINRILLITPNEGLSRQHLDNFNISRISAEIFDKNAGKLFLSNTVEIIEISKLKEEGKEKTVAVDSFENNNLVLIDEVHKGTQGKEWKEKRDRLSTQGFAFEYSATLGQAVKAANNTDIEAEYAKSTIFDYSYKWFYGDGYGKDYRILNLANDGQENIRKLYLTGCLLAYYQQLLVWEQNQDNVKKFNIEKPLWIFVGGTVTAVRNESKKKVSDVLDILLFLSEFIQNKTQSIEYLNRIASGKTGLLDGQGKEVFSNSFGFISSGGLFGEDLFNRILDKVFNAKAQASLHLEDLKGASGEIALRLGENEPFGLINVGDTAELLKLCKEQDTLIVSEKNFNGSMFDSIKSDKSPLNILIGSKKFTEGWDCYRVSTMGLMNIGRSEGSEIIQLFGRGVRLKGFEYCLKRSSALNLNLSNEKAMAIRCLETLNIFGVRADYMRQFQEYLQNEGLPSGSNIKEEFTIPTIRDLPKTKLKVIRVKEGLDFKKQGEKPNLEYHDYIAKNKVILDWYPKVQALKSEKAQGGDRFSEKEEMILSEDLLAFVDWNAIYLDLQNFKADKSWYNLNLNANDIKSIFDQRDWYILYIPREELQITSFSVFDRVYEIVLSLLKKYCEKYYNFKKADWEKDKLEYQEITSEDNNFFDEYKIYVNENQQDLIAKIKELEEIVKSKELKDLDLINGYSFYFDKHLYNPILSLQNNELIEVKPVALNDGETLFLKDLREFYNTNKTNFEKQEMYLLRNKSKTGIGFFEEGNFYPDFILWRVVEGKQYITFIDPKGIRNLDGKNDPKITFFERIKEIEKQLGNTDIILNSVIISNTEIRNINWREDWKQPDFEEHNIFFQDDSNYINKLLSRTI